MTTKFFSCFIITWIFFTQLNLIMSFDFNNTTDSAIQNNNHTVHDYKRVEVAGWQFEELRDLFIFTAVVLLAGFSKVGFHYSERLASLVPESCVLIIIGTVFGVIFLLAGISEELPEFFTPEAFFHFLLPPIILEAAYSLYDRTFLLNIGSILIFAVLGTCFAAFTLGVCLIGLHNVGAMEKIDATPVQILVFSSLIVAVDPVAVLAVFNEVGVNRVLYFLVFGESLLNDGVTVVLYNVMHSFNNIEAEGGSINATDIILGFVKFAVVCLGGASTGVIIGILSSLITKYTQKVKVVEPIAIFGMAYLSYIMAEMFLFSGIISTICCGLVQAAYAFNNLNKKSRSAIKYFSTALSTTTEIIIFMFLGLLLVREAHHWETGFILWTLFLCIIIRFFYTYLFSLLINRYDTSRVRKITLEEMFIMSYGGLRGAVAFSLVALLEPANFPNRDLFITTTLVIIIFTVVVQGASMRPLVNKMRVALATHEEPKMFDELNSKVTDHMMAGFEGIVGHEGNFYLMAKLKRVHDLYLRKFLLKDPGRLDQLELLQSYEKVMIKEHYKNLYLLGATNMKEKVEKISERDSSVMLSNMLSRLDSETDMEKKATEEQGERKSPVEPTPFEFRKFLESRASYNRMIPRAFHDRNMNNYEKYVMKQNLQSMHLSNRWLANERTQQQDTFQRSLTWSGKHAARHFKGELKPSISMKKTASFSGRLDNYTLDTQMVNPVFEVEKDAITELVEYDKNKAEGFHAENSPMDNGQPVIINQNKNSTTVNVTKF